MKKIGYMTLEMALPILVLEHGNEMTPKDLFDLVKHKVTKPEFRKAIDWALGWNYLLRSFRREENELKPYVYFYSRGIEDLHRAYVHYIMESLAEGTLNAPKEKTITLTIKTKDIHTDRLIKAINGLGYAEVIENE